MPLSDLRPSISPFSNLQASFVPKVKSLFPGSINFLTKLWTFQQRQSFFRKDSEHERQGKKRNQLLSSSAGNKHVICLPKRGNRLSPRHVRQISWLHHERHFVKGRPHSLLIMASGLHLGKGLSLSFSGMTKKQARILQTILPSSYSYLCFLPLGSRSATFMFITFAMLGTDVQKIRYILMKEARFDQQLLWMFSDRRRLFLTWTFRFLLHIKYYALQMHGKNKKKCVW